MGIFKFITVSYKELCIPLPRIWEFVLVYLSFVPLIHTTRSLELQFISSIYTVIPERTNRGRKNELQIQENKFCKSMKRTAIRVNELCKSRSRERIAIQEIELCKSMERDITVIRGNELHNLS